MPTPGASPRPDPGPTPARNRVSTARRGTGPVGILFILVVLGVTFYYGPRFGGPLALLWAWWTKVPWRDLGFRRPRNWGLLPATLLMVIVFAGFFEEVIARGFLFERLGKLYGTSRNAVIATVLITATLFGAAHYPEQHCGVQQAFVLALVDGAVFAITRQLWFLIVMHAAFDIAACLIIYFGLETSIANVLFP